ncbi:MAG TPA: hypothetical protein VKG43_10575 [Acidimicrobiales bacterium]|nr:hypothetical protein [Acidimicrobiales bacterium]
MSVLNPLHFPGRHARPSPAGPGSALGLVDPTDEAALPAPPVPGPSLHHRFVVVSELWDQPRQEASFVLRALAGALSRMGRTDVLVPGDPGPARRDGGVDVWTTGSSEGWPVAGTPPHPLLVEDPSRVTALVHLAEAEAVDYVWRSAPGVTVVALTDASDAEEDDEVDPAVAAGGRRPDAYITAVAPDQVDAALAVPLADALVHGVGVHVAVDPAAGSGHHADPGVRDYVLVLADHPENEPHGAAVPRGQSLTPAAAWLAGQFAGHNLVVVESARASAWRGRTLCEVIPVQDRTDLWHLMANARTIVDLDPGSVLGRECVESLRLGTPIIVPDGSSGARHAAAGGGLTYRDVPDLLAAVEQLGDDRLRRQLAADGRELADRLYGDQEGFVQRMRGALASIGVPAAAAS